MNIAIFITFVVTLMVVLAIAIRQSKSNASSMVEDARKRSAERVRANAYADTQPLGLDLATSLSMSVIEGDANLLSAEQEKIIQTLFDDKPVTVENITMDVYRDYWRSAP